MNNIKKNDTVYILTGSDKGKKGQVIEILPKENLVKVSGIAIKTKHAKARKQGEASTIKHLEGYINLSNVMLICPADSKPCRVGFQKNENSKKVRISRRTQQAID